MNIRWKDNEVLCIFSIQVLAWIQSQQYQYYIFLAAAHSQVRFDVSIGIVVSRSYWQNWTLSLAIFLQKCTAILVLSSWLKSWLWDLVSWRQRFIFHQMTSLDHASAHNDPPSVTTSLLCGSLLSTSDLIRQSKFPSLAWWEEPLWQILPSFDQESSILPYRLAASCNCWFFIAKAYQVIPCLIISWSLIVLTSLKPIPDFVHLKSLVICAPLVHCVARLHITSLFGFAMRVTSLMRLPLLIIGVLAYPWT
jgi:hypothetical protein